MTFEDAKIYLRDWRNVIERRGGTGFSDAVLALNMAIEALELVGKTDKLEPIVRCKDCIHAEREGGKLTCPYWMGYYMRGDVVVVEPEGFCSYGDDGEGGNDERY